MALLRLAHRWSMGREKPPRLSVLTVDHALRAGSAAEAEQVKAWCRALGLDHHTLTWNGPRPASGIQAMAREARYHLMSRWCLAQGVPALFTAHTLDDQAETVLMRMQRTASIDSLAGIPAMGEWGGVLVVRPLLGLRRDDLRARLNALGQDWIDDPSNADLRFERVRLRHVLADAAGAGCPAEELAGLAADCAAAAAALQRRTDQWISGHVTVAPEGSAAMRVAAFRALPDSLRQRVLGRLVRRIGGGPVEPAETARLEAVLLGGGRRRTLGGAMVWLRGDCIVLCREAARISPAPLEVWDSGRVIWDRRFAVHAPPGSLVVPGLHASGLERRDGLPKVVRDAMPAVRLPDGRDVLASCGGEGPVRAVFLNLKTP